MPIDLKKKLEAAVQYVKNTCILGPSNIFENYAKTGGWANLQIFRYLTSGKYVQLAKVPPTIDDKYVNAVYDPNTEQIQAKYGKWYFHVADANEVLYFPENKLYRLNLGVNPLDDPRFNLERIHKRILINALLAISKRQANCGAYCDLLIKYLWENPEGIDRIAIIELNGFDHSLAIINYKGDIQKIEQWGNQTWVVDIWYPGSTHVYPATELVERIKAMLQFALQQKDRYEKIGLYPSKVNIDDYTWTLVREVIPTVHLYPSYQKGMKFEDYYAIDDMSYNDRHSPAAKQARSKLKTCMAELEQHPGFNQSKQSNKIAQLELKRFSMWKSVVQAENFPNNSLEDEKDIVTLEDKPSCCFLS